MVPKLSVWYHAVRLIDDDYDPHGLDFGFGKMTGDAVPIVS